MILNIITENQCKKIIDDRVSYRFNEIFQQINLLKLKLDRLEEENKVMRIIINQKGGKNEKQFKHLIS